MSAIADIRKDIPIHLELASMTDKEYMSRIMQEVHVEMSDSCVMCVFSLPHFLLKNPSYHLKTVPLESMASVNS